MAYDPIGLQNAKLNGIFGNKRFFSHHRYDDVLVKKGTIALGLFYYGARHVYMVFGTTNVKTVEY